MSTAIALIALAGLLAGLVLLGIFLGLAAIGLRFNPRLAARLIVAAPLAGIGAFIGASTGDALVRVFSLSPGALTPWAALFGAGVVALFMLVADFEQAADAKSQASERARPEAR